MKSCKKVDWVQSIILWLIEKHIKVHSCFIYSLQSNPIPQWSNVIERVYFQIQLLIYIQDDLAKLSLIFVIYGMNTGIETWSHHDSWSKFFKPDVPSPSVREESTIISQASLQRHEIWKGFSRIHFPKTVDQCYPE